MNTTAPVAVAGAFKETLLAPLSRSTILLLPVIVMSLFVVSAPELMVPVVLIVAEPVIKPLFMVPVLITG